MARPIDGDFAAQQIRRFACKRGLDYSEQMNILQCATMVRESPTMTLEPEPMEWISMAKPEADAWRECSACGAEVKGIAFPFCPYCGRKARNGVNTHE